MTSQGGTVTTSQVFTDIVFDRPLDPALFDLNPPAGYQVETFGVAQLPARADRQGSRRAGSNTPDRVLDR